MTAFSCMTVSAKPKESDMWTYEQTTGAIADNAGKVVGSGYSGGNKGDNPEGVNNPAMQREARIGPLPQGIYTIEAPVDRPTTGPYSIPLEPDPANHMFGRSEFLIHGDVVGHVGKRRASEGCIILAPEIRHAVWNSGDHKLHVVA
jgi:lipoprotein-anchoring transpeptidase ErfK/SrfK